MAAPSYPVGFIMLICWIIISQVLFTSTEASQCSRYSFPDNSSLSVSFVPTMLKTVPENTEHTVSMSACVNTTSNLDSFPTQLKVWFTAKDLKTLRILTESPAVLQMNETNWNNSSVCYSGNFLVRAVRLGRSSVKVQISLDDNNCTETYEVTVVRAYRVVDVVFNIGLVVMLVVNNIGFGCKFDIAIAKNIVKKPVAPVIGFICQYGFMPVLAFLLGRALSLSPALAFGLMATGAAPGGGQSNVWTILLDGDITLSICMTLISSFASLGMMPLWLLTLGKFILQNDKVQIPFLEIFISLLVLVVPLTAGLAMRKCLPKVADLICKLVKPTALVFILYLLTLGVYSNWYAILFMVNDWRILVAGLLLPWTGSIISAIAAVVFRQPWTRVKTISIETAYQNSAISILVLRNSLVQPEADLTSVMPVAVTIGTPIPFVVALLVKVVLYLCRRGKTEEQEGDEGQKDIKLVKMQTLEALPDTSSNVASDSTPKSHQVAARLEQPSEKTVLAPESGSAGFVNKGLN